MRRSLCIASLSCVLFALTACGGGGGDSAPNAGGGGGGAGGTPVAYDVITTAVSGSTPDAAVGDTFTYLLTGAPPNTTRIESPFFTFLASNVSGNTAVLNDPDNGSFSVNLVSASQVNTTASFPIFDGTTGAKTGTRTFTTTQQLVAHTAPSTTGAFAATVTSVSKGTTYKIGDKFYFLIKSPGFISFADVNGNATLSALVKSGTRWESQVSEWNGTAVASSRISIAGDLASGTFKFSEGATSKNEFEFSVASLAVPATITGVRFPAASFIQPGTAPGYNSNAYFLSIHAADRPFTIAVNAVAGTMTVDGKEYGIFNFGLNSATNIGIQGARFFTDPALTTTDKRAYEVFSVETTPSGTFVQGFSGVALWVDPTPDNDGGNKDNDDSLGLVFLYKQ